MIVPPINALKLHVGNDAILTSSLSNDIGRGVAAAKGKDVAFVFVNA
jgi:beta-glucosidase